VVVLNRDRCVAVQAVAVCRSIGAEGKGRLSARRAQRELRLLSGIGATKLHGVSRVRFGADVALRKAELPLEDVVHENTWKLRAGHVAEHHDAELVLWHHAHRGRHAERIPSVLPDELMAEVFDDPAHAVGAERHERIGRPELAWSDDGLGRVCHLECGRAHETLAVVHAVGELEAQPLRHVARVGVDRARGRDVFEAAASERVHAVVRGSVRRCEVRPVVLGHGCDTGRHAERLEDTFGDEIVPRGTGGFGRRFTGGEIHHVLIPEAGAESPRRFEIAHATQYFVARDVSAEPNELAAGQAAAVGERVADRELGAGVWVVEAEAGQVVGDVCVPAHFSVADEHRDDGRRERLGARADLEERVIVDRCRIAECADAVALGIEHGVVSDDGDADARHVPRREGLIDVCVEAWERFLGGGGQMAEPDEGRGEEPRPQGAAPGGVHGSGLGSEGSDAAARVTRRAGGISWHTKLVWRLQYHAGGPAVNQVDARMPAVDRCGIPSCAVPLLCRRR